MRTSSYERDAGEDAEEGEGAGEATGDESSGGRARIEGGGREEE